MIAKNRLRIAIQKKGRLNNDSMDLLEKCGIKISDTKNSLLCHAENLPIDLLFVRDDDIPTLVMDNICDIGIVGENVLLEKDLSTNNKTNNSDFQIIKKLGFSKCRLSIAVANNEEYSGIGSLRGMKIATSYPEIIKKFLAKNKLNADVLVISGSVEIAPSLNMADAICDLVSTGRTLEENNLKEVTKVLDSQAVLIKPIQDISPEKQDIYELLIRRIDGAIKAKDSKYIMFHAPRSALEKTKQLLPGVETQTIIPIEGKKDQVVVHVVTREAVFWDTLESLKSVGASAILVLPIEKILN